jgi:hypothetical protein
MHERMTRAELLASGAGVVFAGLGARAAFGLLEANAATGNVRRFVSRPDLVPPDVTVARRAPGTASGLLFVAPSSGPGQRGAMIFDDAGELVWFHRVEHKAVTDFKVQSLHGKPVLTWWEGKVKDGIGDGEWVVLDASYRELARFGAARGLPADLHEFMITAHGTALVTANEQRGRNVGGVVQELELPSGRLLWEWRSLDHVAVDETMIKGKPGPHFDYFHVNSIDVDADGNLIVSARNTWAAYKVERHSGRVLWRLGGKRSDFAFGAGARFEWQHDVRHHAGGIVTVFDNAAAPAKEPQSRALVLKLDESRKRVTLVRAYVHRPERVLSHFMGNAQLLANGNVVVGWGGSPFVTEFARDGTIVFDSSLPKGGQSYRAFRFPWVGRPADRPALVERGGMLYASWNGATEVASWRVDGETTPRTGFETVLRATRGVVAALDKKGKVLGAASVS